MCVCVYNEHIINDVYEMALKYVLYIPSVVDHEESVSVNGAQFSWDSENPGRATLSE